MIKHADSHLDHNLTEAQIAHILERFKDRTQFFLETFELPEGLGTAPCRLYGPLMGDEPFGNGWHVSHDREVYSKKRGARSWESRLVHKPTRPTRLVTVIGGPHEWACTKCGHDPEIPRGRVYAGEVCFSTLTASCGCDMGRLRGMILYTAYAGPAAPQEPGDPGCKNVENATKFWSEHALADHMLLD